MSDHAKAAIIHKRARRTCGLVQGCDFAVLQWQSAVGRCGGTSHSSHALLPSCPRRVPLLYAGPKLQSTPLAMSAVAASNRNASSSGQTSQTLWGVRTPRRMPCANHARLPPLKRSQPLTHDARPQRLPGVSIGNQALIGALAGGFAGGVTNALLYPLDTVKTKLQLRGAEQLYSGPIDVVRKVIEKEGVRGLLAGAQAGVFGAMLSSALYFGAYETAKGALSTPVRVRVRVRRPAAGALAQSRPAQGEGQATGKGGKAKAAGGKGPQAPALVASVTELGGEGDEWETRPLVRPALVPPLAAFLGNIASSLILVPKEVVKQQLQAEGGAGGSALGLARAILRTEGVRGLYRGYASTILRNAPGNVISFSGYELLKQLQLDRLPPGSVLPPLVNMGTGARARISQAPAAHSLTATLPASLCQAALSDGLCRRPQVSLPGQWRR